MTRDQFEDFILLLRQKLEYVAIFDLFDCIAKDDQISVEEWNLGISNLKSLELEYFQLGDFQKITSTRDVFGKEDFMLFCYSRQIITLKNRKKQIKILLAT